MAQILRNTSRVEPLAGSRMVCAPSLRKSSCFLRSFRVRHRTSGALGVRRGLSGNDRAPSMPSHDAPGFGFGQLLAEGLMPCLMPPARYRVMALCALSMFQNTKCWDRPLGSFLWIAPRRSARVVFSPRRHVESPPLDLCNSFAHSCQEHLG